MNGLPYYKRYPRDLVEGTIGMPFEVKVTYAFVLDLIYMQGGKLVDDPRYISGLLGVSLRKWKSLRMAIIEAGKIQAEDGFLTNYRAFSELESLAKYSRKQAENRRRPNKNNDLEKPALNHTDTDIKDISFIMENETEISEGQLHYASERNISVNEAKAQFVQFKNNAISKALKFADWDRAFAGWLDSPNFRRITPPDIRSVGGTEHDKDAVAVQAIQSGKRFLCTQITASHCQRLIDGGQVTTDQARKVGVL